MTTIKRYVLLLMFSAISACVYSQEGNWGIWYEVNAEHKLTDKLNINLSGDVRTDHGGSKVYLDYLDAGGTYKFNKYLSVSGNYRLIYCFEKDDAYHFRHRWYTDIKGTLPLWNFYLSGRFRFQEQFRTYYKHEEDKIAYRGRIKVETGYNIPSFPVDPHVSVELFCPMFDDADRTVNKVRFAAGLHYKINKKNALEAEYILQRNFASPVSNFNILSFSYTIKI